MTTDDNTPGKDGVTTMGELVDFSTKRPLSRFMALYRYSIYKKQEEELKTDSVTQQHLQEALADCYSLVNRSDGIRGYVIAVKTSDGLTHTWCSDGTNDGLINALGLRIAMLTEEDLHE